MKCESTFLVKISIANCVCGFVNLKFCHTLGLELVFTSRSMNLSQQLIQFRLVFSQFQAKWFRQTWIKHLTTNKIFFLTCLPQGMYHVCIQYLKMEDFMLCRQIDRLFDWKWSIALKEFYKDTGTCNHTESASNAFIIFSHCLCQYVTTTYVFFAWCLCWQKSGPWSM